MLTRAIRHAAAALSAIDYDFRYDVFRLPIRQRYMFRQSPMMPLFYAMPLYYFDIVIAC